MILIALLVGGQLLGIAGALLAIPVAEIIRKVVTELLAYRRTRQEAEEPPFHRGLLDLAQRAGQRVRRLRRTEDSHAGTGSKLPEIP